MSSAAKANAVVSVVGDEDAAATEAEGGAGGSEGEAVTCDGDAAVLGLTTVEPQAARTTAAATKNQAGPRG